MERSHSEAFGGFKKKVPSKHWGKAASVKCKTKSDLPSPGGSQEKCVSEHFLESPDWCAELPVPDQINAIPSGASAASSPNPFASGRSSKTYAASGSDSAHGEAVQMELLRVQNLMLRVAARHPELQATEEESTEESISRLAMHYRRLVESSANANGSAVRDRQDEAQIRQLRSDLAYEQKRHKDLHQRDEEHKARLQAKVYEMQRQLAEKVAAFTEEKDILKAQVQTLQHGNSSSSADVKIFKEKIEHQKALHSRELEALNRKVVQTEGDLKRIRETYERQLRKAAEEHKAASQKLQSSLEDRYKNDKVLVTKQVAELENRLMEERKDWNVHIKEKEKETKSRIESTEKQTAESLNRMKGEHGRAMRNHKVAFAEEVQALQENNAKQVKALEKMIQDLSTKYEVQQEELHNAQKSQNERRIEEDQRLQVVVQQHEQTLRKQFEQENNSLRHIIEHFKRDATRISEPKGLNDSEIIAKFARLANAVEDFSRLQWDPAKEAGWWQEQFEQLQARNRRRIKQQIVQNSVWMTLYKRVLQSPFKFFEEDKTWKEQNKIWLEIYAAGDSSSTWPKIAEHLENARCDNAKQLRATIQASQPAGGDQTMTEIQSMYEQLISHTVNGIAVNISKVVLLKDRDLKLLENVVRTATDLWLECCSQRYRLIVSLVTGIEDILGLSQGHIRMVKLMLKPGLRRFGTLRGGNLAEEQIIHGWRSQFEVYPCQRSVSG